MTLRKYLHGTRINSSPDDIFLSFRLPFVLIPSLAIIEQCKRYHSFFFLNTKPRNEGGSHVLTGDGFKVNIKGQK